MDDTRFTELVQSGVKLQTIADEFGMTISGVSYHIRRLKLPQRGSRRGPPLKAGDKLGQWTLLERTVRESPPGHLKGFWLCRCSCGRECYVQAGLLRAGKTSHCKPCTNRWVKEAAVIPTKCWKSIQIGAAARNHEFSVTREEVEQLLLRQEHRCAITGLPIWFASNWQEHRKPDGTTASLDRIDSTRGYVTGNIQWVHKDVNKMKHAYPESRFIEICCLAADKARGVSDAAKPHSATAA